jgi:UDP-3-O-acyl-N-acetylglucosamine deacetylase
LAHTSAFYEPKKQEYKKEISHARTQVKFGLLLDIGGIDGAGECIGVDDIQWCWL